MPSLRQLLDVIDAQHVFCPNAVSRDMLDGLSFASVSTDTRTLQPGALFFALTGPHFDANALVAAAKEKGAVAAVVVRMDAQAQACNMPLIQVADSLAALQAWAAFWRRQWSGQVIAVTGSNGKTTVKQMLAAVLQAACGAGHAWATPGNLNNHIGLPLSVLGLSDAHRMAVLELGMNHPGEIAGLAAIAMPNVALVNNAQREHQEFMESVAAVARENGQVFGKLPDDGTAVFTRDAQHESIWRELAGSRHTIRFGMQDASADPSYRGAEVTGQWIGSGTGQMLRVGFPNGASVDLALRGIGDHFAHNALASCACAFAAGIAPEVMRQALNAFEPVRGRGQKRLLAGGGLLIDDSYNANPDSVHAAIDAIGSLAAPRALVLGDMGEVGHQGQAFHEEVLHHAQRESIEGIWLHGDAFASASRATGIGAHRSDIADLIEGLRSWAREQQALGHLPSVWVKGSRFMKMERVVQALACEAGEVAACC